LLSARAFEALDARKQELGATLFGSQVEEEVEELEEGTMTGITLGAKVKNKQGGFNQDVHHKGEKIGHIEAYKHRTGMRYGSHHDASGDGSAGNRSPEESIDDIRYSHAQHLKDNRVKKEEVEELDELSKDTLGSYVKKAKGSAIGSSQVMGMGSKMTGQKTQDKAEKTVQKRASGINKAVDRLTK
jgi:hypothetical protein